MVKQNDEYPEFPKLKCQGCDEVFEVPRHWVRIHVLGNQIVIDWDAAEVLMKAHYQFHTDELVQGAEDLLRANT